MRAYAQLLVQLWVWLARCAERAPEPSSARERLPPVDAPAAGAAARELSALEKYGVGAAQRLRLRLGMGAHTAFSARLFGQPRGAPSAAAPTLDFGVLGRPDDTVVLSCAAAAATAASCALPRAGTARPWNSTAAATAAPRRESVCDSDDDDDDVDAPVAAARARGKTHAERMEGLGSANAARRKADTAALVCGAQRAVEGRQMALTALAGARAAVVALLLASHACCVSLQAPPVVVVAMRLVTVVELMGAYILQVPSYSCVYAECGVTTVHAADVDCFEVNGDATAQASSVWISVQLLQLVGGLVEKGTKFEGTCHSSQLETSCFIDSCIRLRNRVDGGDRIQAERPTTSRMFYGV